MTLYRSLTTGEVLSADDVMDCEWCADGVTLDDETCPNCGGTGKLEGHGIRGDNYAPRRVVVVQDPLMTESLHTVCAECGTVIVEGPKVDGRSSHGLCPRHYRMQMASIAVRAATKYGTAIRNHDRQSDEVVRAHNRMVAAIYDIVDAPSEALEDR